MIKRAFDILVALSGLIGSAPILLPACLAIWWQDYHSPFYIAPRVGRHGRSFRMVKLRSMVVRADRSGVDSTAGNDPRITVVGRFIRKTKLDELPQLWNVLRGDMSLVGPRPNVEREVALYTMPERGLLDVQPGITDFSSIVFADEGDILHGQDDPDVAYNQLIRPWKSRLGLFYIEHRGVLLDVRLIALTVLGAISRRQALLGVHRALRQLGAADELCRVALRDEPLTPRPPLGSDSLVLSRAATV